MLYVINSNRHHHSSNCLQIEKAVSKMSYCCDVQDILQRSSTVVQEILSLFSTLSV